MNIFIYVVYFFSFQFQFVYLTIIVSEKSDVFSSDKMESYLETQKSVLRVMENMAWSKLHRNRILKRNIKRFRVDYDYAKENTSLFFGNPINCFRIIKRLTVDLQLLMKIFKKYLFDFEWDETLEYPSEQELLDAAFLNIRLMDNYVFNTTELADGFWRTNYSANSPTFFIEDFPPMTASDCIELGKAMYKLRYPLYGITWISEGYRKWEDDYTKGDVHFTSDDIQRLLNDGYDAIESIERKFEQWVRRLNLLSPEAKTMSKDTIYQSYQEGLTVEETAKIYKQIARIRENKPSIYRRFIKSGPVDFVSLCRGQKIEMNESYRRNYNLQCTYAAGPKYLNLFRYKLEQLNHKPSLILYHDIIGNSEIEILLNMTRGKLRPTNNNDGVNKLFQLAHFKWNSSTVLKRLSQKVSAITGMKIMESDVMEIDKYHVGGYYELHYDASTDPEVIREKGNNLATMIFYLSEVLQGGATAFPRLGVSVFPVRGSALLWQNLDSAGRRMMTTLHGTCPVLRGSKWLLIHRVNTRGQELRHPCPIPIGRT